MSSMRFVIMLYQHDLTFVEMPASHAYQLSALNQRLNKEVGKLTARNVPTLPQVIGECNDLELIHPQYSTVDGLTYINELEQTFVKIQESNYPLISLLTEIRALQAQLEQWYEEI